MIPKLFISADIEGTAGINTWDETGGGGLYGYFAAQMTREVAAAIEGAEAAGFTSTVKDAHDSARNLDPAGLPRSARLIRGWCRDMWCMMGGLDQEHYDAVAFTGYHSDAMSNGNSLSHTMDTGLQAVYLNGARASEFVINAHMAAYLGIPIVFLSGDEALCETAKQLIPGIRTVAAKVGLGSATMARHPEVVCDDIRMTMQHALEGLVDPAVRASCMLTLPETFELVVAYKDWNTAHRNSFFPGAETLDAKTLSFRHTNFYEVMRFMHFCM